jgi:hypothetical protein
MVRCCCGAVTDQEANPDSATTGTAAANTPLTSGMTRNTTTSERVAMITTRRGPYRSASAPATRLPAVPVTPKANSRSATRSPSPASAGANTAPM